MRRQGLKGTYLSTRTKLIKCFKLSATTEPLLLHRCCYSQLFYKIMYYQFEQQFRKEMPQTVGETDSHFDLDNYKDWLEQKLIASNVALNDLVFQVKQYASGDIGTMDYFRDELKVAENAFVSLG